MRWMKKEKKKKKKGVNANQIDISIRFFFIPAIENDSAEIANNLYISQLSQHNQIWMYMSDVGVGFWKHFEYREKFGCT